MTGMTRRGLLTGGVATGVLAAAVGPGPAVAAGQSPRRPSVRTGFEVLHADDYAQLRGEKVGIISNPTGILPDLGHEVDVMHASPHVELVAAFGPEHGFRGSAQAGGSEGSYTDPRTGVPVYDLFGKSVEKITEFFTQSGVDALLFDIQDVGARFYTYIWTMYSSMKAAALAGKRFIVLDRPNPLGGRAATGPVLRPEFASGVGLQPIAQQHGMTVAELAGLFNVEFLAAEIGRRAELSVVRMQGWRRGMSYQQTGLPWVLPSPNMPTVDTAMVYPGLGLFEAVNLSEGRGTTRPFEIVGAPYVDWHWVDALTELRLPGAAFREAYFAPTFAKWQGQNCAGVQISVTDRERFDPIHTAISMIVTARRLYPDGFAWRESAAPFWMDKLTGTDWTRTAIDAGKDADEIVAGWQTDLQAFRAQRAGYLLYR